MSTTELRNRIVKAAFSSNEGNGPLQTLHRDTDLTSIEAQGAVCEAFMYLRDVQDPATAKTLFCFLEQNNHPWEQVPRVIRQAASLAGAC